MTETTRKHNRKNVLSRWVVKGKTKKARVKTFRNNKELLLMTLPAVIKIFIFSYLPMIGIIIAFKDYMPAEGVFGSEWIGFKNFEFFFKSIDAWRVTSNTLYLNAIFIIVDLMVSIAFALMLYEVSQKWLLKTYQSILFFPYFLSWVIVGIITTTVLGSNYGVLTRFLNDNLGTQIDFYTQPAYWPIILCFIYVWKRVGYVSLLYYSALLSIDKELFEAAEIDGASKLQKIRHIGIPFIKPMAFVLTIISIGNILRSDFGLFYFVPRDIGVLYPTTDVIDTYIFRALRKFGDFGMSSAVGFFQSIIGFILVVVANKVSNKVDKNYSLY